MKANAHTQWGFRVRWFSASYFAVSVRICCCCCLIRLYFVFGIIVSAGCRLIAFNIFIFEAGVVFCLVSFSLACSLCVVLLIVSMCVCLWCVCAAYFFVGCCCCYFSSFHSRVGFGWLTDLLFFCLVSYHLYYMIITL